MWTCFFPPVSATPFPQLQGTGGGGGDAALIWSKTKHKKTQLRFYYIGILLQKYK